MKLHFGILATYISVFAITYFDTSNGSFPFYELPANSTDTLYLVGNSLEGYDGKISCMRTSFISREGEVVTRNLTFNYTERFNETPPVEKTFHLQVKVPDTPIMFNLEVNATDRGLLNYTEVQSTYRIIHYDNVSMVLGNIMPTLSELARCSLWVKENFTMEDQIPFMANVSFQTNCKSPHHFGYLDSCGRS
ncbi:japanin-like [Dermacentor andersoni]|uniref:japanin-like n=1 Tax=Dermacentor andersoni TaxID=34620 RepID=UPI002418122E|nr:japanin-like [Dermacentor andersoni]